MEGAGDAAGASRLRIAAGGKNWKAVLGVAASACTEDVKKAYRKLVLLHHPDKLGGDVDTFRLVHQAYVLGLKKCRHVVAKSGAAAPATARCSPAKPKRQPAKADPVIPTWLRQCFTAKPEAPQAPAADDSDDDVPQPSPAQAVPSPAKPKAKGKAKGKAKAKAKAAASAAAPSSPPARPAAAAPAASRGTVSSPRSPLAADTPSPTAALRRAAEKMAAAEAEAPAAKRPARPKPWVLAEFSGASKAKVIKALKAWENTALDIEGSRTRPGDIGELSPEALAGQLRLGACLAVDVRDNRTGAEIQGSEYLSFGQLFNSPDELLPRIAKLKEDTRQLVLLSDEGERLGTCALVGAALVDVFCFDASRVLRLSGGYAAWSQFLDVNPSVSRTVEPLAARLARRRAAAAAAAGAPPSASLPKVSAPEPLFSFCVQHGGG